MWPTIFLRYESNGTIYPVVIGYRWDLLFIIAQHLDRYIIFMMIGRIETGALINWLGEDHADGRARIGVVLERNDVTHRVLIYWFSERYRAWIDEEHLIKSKLHQIKP